jgi:hypothetical protein
LAPEGAKFNPKSQPKESAQETIDESAEEPAKKSGDKSILVRKSHNKFDRNSGLHRRAGLSRLGPPTRGAFSP